MINLIPLTQWATKKGHTDAAARQLIRRGKLPEAKKIGRNWLISPNTEWPEDRRYKIKPGD